MKEYQATKPVRTWVPGCATTKGGLVLGPRSSPTAEINWNNTYPWFLIAAFRLLLGHPALRPGARCLLPRWLTEVVSLQQHLNELFGSSAHPAACAAAFLPDVSSAPLNGDNLSLYSTSSRSLLCHVILNISFFLSFFILAAKKRVFKWYNSCPGTLPGG